MGIMQFQSQQTCSSCGGRGKAITEICPVCGGSGTYRQKEQLILPIDKGIPEGFNLKIPYGADENPSYAPGDLYIEVYSVSNRIPFRRDYQHLHYDLTISLLE